MRLLKCNGRLVAEHHADRLPTVMLNIMPTVMLMKISIGLSSLEKEHL